MSVHDIPQRNKAAEWFGRIEAAIYNGEHAILAIVNSKHPNDVAASAYAVADAIAAFRNFKHDSDYTLLVKEIGVNTTACDDLERVLQGVFQVCRDNPDRAPTECKAFLAKMRATARLIWIVPETGDHEWTLRLPDVERLAGAVQPEPVPNGPVVTQGIVATPSRLTREAVAELRHVVTYLLRMWEHHANQIYYARFRQKQGVDDCDLVLPLAEIEAASSCLWSAISQQGTLAGYAEFQHIRALNRSGLVYDGSERYNCHLERMRELVCRFLRDLPTIQNDRILVGKRCEYLDALLQTCPATEPQGGTAFTRDLLDKVICELDAAWQALPEKSQAPATATATAETSGAQPEAAASAREEVWNEKDWTRRTVASERFSSAINGVRNECTRNHKLPRDTFQELTPNAAKMRLVRDLDKRNQMSFSGRAYLKRRAFERYLDDEVNREKRLTDDEAERYHEINRPAKSERSSYPF